MSKRKDVCAEDDMGFGTFIVGMLLGIWAGSLFTFVMLDNVDVEQFGKLACEDQGLAYSGYHWHEEHAGVPVIECVEPPVSVVDGVIVKVQ